MNVIIQESYVSYWHYHPELGYDSYFKTVFLQMVALHLEGGNKEILTYFYCYQNPYSVLILKHLRATMILFLLYLFHLVLWLELSLPKIETREWSL